MFMRTEQQVLAQLCQWAQGNDLVRAVILTGSRAAPERSVDILSDYDIALYVQDLQPFQQDDAWLHPFGPILVRWPLQPRTTFDENWLTRLVLFKDGVRLDFQITDGKQIASEDYDAGFRVLLDKDALTAGLNAPTFSTYLVTKPSREAYTTLVHEFWWDAIYVPKYLWRDELPYAKYMLDHELRYAYLNRMLAWCIGSRHRWSVRLGPHGRGLKRYLEPAVWAAYESTYASSAIEENWDALFRLFALFEASAVRLGSQLGYAYPVAMASEVAQYCAGIRATATGSDVEP